MISFKGRESKRGRIYKMSRNLERLYKEGKCRECKVLVTRMDFAKILGKFTKVKIQYESSSPPKVKKSSDSNTSNINSKLKSNENGMVVIHKNTSKQQAAKPVQSSKKLKIKDNLPESVTEIKQVPHQTSNILKENNGMKKSQLVKDKTCSYAKKPPNTNLKQYGIVFTDPTISNNNNNNEINSKMSLLDILPNLNRNILPSEDWSIDYFPTNDEPKQDKVYDRIAAELEDLMYNDKPVEKIKSEESEMKVDEFPSIMDILNDNTVDNTLISKETEQSSSEQFKTNLESSDVEAMLLGKGNVENKDTESSTMEVDSTDVSQLIEDMDQFSNISEDSKLHKVVIEDVPEPIEINNTIEEVENPQSPSILDEALQKGIEEHLPNENKQKDESSVTTDNTAESKGNEINETISDNEHKSVLLEVKIAEDVAIPIANDHNENDNAPVFHNANITHVVFKKILNGKCNKSVTCPKNLKYSIELQEKSVEFIGAPKYISSIEDLRVLLQIVNESELENLYVFH